MFTGIVNKVGEPLKKSLKNSKLLKILAKKKNSKYFYQIKEYLCYLIGIGEFKPNPKMNTLTLLFADGVILTTVAYIDDPTIEEKSLISIIGYIDKYNNQLQFHCCAGLERAFDTIPDILSYADTMDLNKAHKISPIFSLSEALESAVYQETANITQFEDTNFYCIEEDFKIASPKTSLDAIGLNKLISSSPKVTKEYPDYVDLEAGFIDPEDLVDSANNPNQ